MVQGGIAFRAFVCLLAVAGCLTAAATASGSVYFGAFVSGETYGETGVAPGNATAWNRFERHAGKKVAILNQNQAWLTFNATAMNATNARGAIPLVTMPLGSGVTLAEVAAGKKDTAIKQWALAAKQWGHPFLFGPWWEMNGGWYLWGRSTEFVKAWRRFHDVVVAAGATNVTWTWITNAIWYDPLSDPTPYYPGNAYVDWAGIDSYNWGLGPAQSDKWHNPDGTLTPTLDIVNKLTNGERPVAIVEEASSEYGGSKADWIRELLTTYVPRHPEIGAYLWFNWNMQKNGVHFDWPIESSATAQQAFRRAIQSGFYTSAPVSLPALTKVPAPPAGTADPAQPADLSGPAEMATGADVAVAADGTATVAWSARDGGAFAVFTRRIAPDGTPGTTVRLSDPAQDALDPRVAVAPDGTATVAWVRSDGTSLLVQARRIAPDGTPEAGTKNLSQTGRDASAPQLAVAADGTATVAWQRFDGFNYLVQERRLDPAGNRIPPESVNELSAAAADAVEPQVVTGPGGAATVVWSRYTSTGAAVEAQRIEASGAPAAATAVLSPTDRNAVQPRIATAGDGSAAVVWTVTESGHTMVQGLRLNSAGNPLSPPLLLSAPGGDAVEPDLAVGPDGAATAVWERFDGAAFVIQGRRLLADGSLAAPLDLSAAGADAAEPAVAVSPAGTATVLWSRSDGSRFLVQRRDLGAAGSLVATETLSAAGRSASAPAVAWGSDGTLAATWRRFDGRGDVVQAKFVPRPVIPPPPTPSDPPAGGASGSGSRTSAKPTPRTVNNSFTIGKPALNRKRGTASLPVTIPGAGAVAVEGAKPARRDASAAGKLVLRIAPTRSQRSQLAQKGALRLRLVVTFSPVGGVPNSSSVVVRLRKRSLPG
jgi:hypothetical protein